jgi:hypothetical protein
MRLVVVGVKVGGHGVVVVEVVRVMTVRVVLYLIVREFRWLSWATNIGFQMTLVVRKSLQSCPA